MNVLHQTGPNAANYFTNSSLPVFHFADCVVFTFFSETKFDAFQVLPSFTVVRKQSYNYKLLEGKDTPKGNFLL